ncbi:unnamed protein product [Rotaria sp. Silwood1]|nr:unnamed protein product [Rotaria sp. Silwood1]CAF3433021.1 unnamed protein product [Rotaria sp. Silwood1]CAF4963304.1 unnamed protein product [Rotaria sp. Silwood1]
MCILFCYLQNDNIDIGYDLILLSNRDEDFQRPAKQAHVWKDTKYALGGQDVTPLREGGTWLCLNTVQSRIGILLNLSSHLLEEKNINAQSRGFIVSNYVNNPEINLDTYMDELQKTKTNYTGFNFLGLEQQSESKGKITETSILSFPISPSPYGLFYINRKWRAKYINNVSPDSSAIEINTSVFGFSNHIYGDQYAFEKTRYGCQLFKTFLANLTDNYTKPITDEKALIHQTFDLLNDNKIFPDDPNIATIYSHYSISNRHQISSINVRTTDDSPTYGTRTSTVILIRRNQTGLFIEKTLSNPLINPSEWTENTWHFKLYNMNEPPILIN